MQFTRQHPRTLVVRKTAYNRDYKLHEFVISVPKVSWKSDLYHESLNSRLLPLVKKKYNQLQELKIFVSQEHQPYYEALPYVQDDKSEEEFDVSVLYKTIQLKL